MASCLYVAANLTAVRIVSYEGLAATTERHRLEIAVAPATECLDPLAELDRMPSLLGAIVEMERGWAGQVHLRFAAKVLGRGRRVWFYWPNESAIEVVDRDRLWTGWRLWLFITVYRALRRARNEKAQFAGRCRSAGAWVVPVAPPASAARPR